MRSAGRSLWRRVRDAPDPVTGAVLGGAGTAAVGGAMGLVLGLHAYAPTAWAATVELGAPAAVLGAVSGGFVGFLTRALRVR